MKKDFRLTLTAKATSHEAFSCINQVTKWWTENVEGSSFNLNEEFTVRFDDVHVSTQKLIEFVPDSKVVWLVTKSRLNFVKIKDEWTNTKIIFELEDLGATVRIKFAHIGLLPAVECYDGCSDAWSDYLQNSLVKYIETGKGKPTPKAKV